MNKANNDNFYLKYIKAKNRYLELKYNQLGSGISSSKTRVFGSNSDSDSVSDSVSDSDYVSDSSSGSKETKFSVVTYNVFGVKDGFFIEDRVDSIIKAIFRRGEPDVICLQEATSIVIDSILSRYRNYKVRTKLYTIDREKK